MKEINFKSVLLETRVSIVSAILLSVFNLGFIFEKLGGGWFGSLCAFMEFDRALIFKGELWRVITCHLVHWSPQHFFLDALVCVALGFVFEQRIGPRYFKVLMAAALLISTALIFFQSGLQTYRGISGLINTQFILGVGLFVFDRNNRKFMKGLYVIIFSIHVFKVAYETIHGVSFFSTESLGDMGLFTPLAHLTGALVGFWYLFKFSRPQGPRVFMTHISFILDRARRSVGYFI